MNMAINVEEAVIGILGGTGDQGRGLAYRFARAGHRVIIGSRSEERALAAAGELAASLPEGSAGSVDGMANADTSRHADLVIAAIPWEGHADLLTSLSGDLAGKIVIDCVNPLGFDAKGAYPLPVPEGSAAQQAAVVLPDSTVVAAFHHVSAKLLLDAGVDTIDLDVLVLGEDREATDLVQALAGRIPGVRGVYAGRLRNAGQVEALTANLVAVNRRYKAHAGLRVTDILRLPIVIKDRQPGEGAVGLPFRASSPLRSVGKRALVAVGLVIACALIVYSARSGYKDSAHPDQPLSFLGALYYSTVTLTTTGYGDIVPVTNLTRLENTFILTPIRVAFLIALVGTTLGVLAERTRTGWRVARWRSKVDGHTIVVGFGTMGRAAVRTLLEARVPPDTIVVVDQDHDAVREANATGLTAVAGDATRTKVLASAEADKASRIIVAVPRDDTAVLITLTARQLSPGAVIVATIRASENEPLLHQSGADHVIISAEAAGRLLGLTATDSAVGGVIANLLSCEDERGLSLYERQVAQAEVGTAAASAGGPVVAVVRGATVMAPDDPRLGALTATDRLVLSTPPASGTTDPRARG
jgi:NADPH-dependent F420 reductase